MKAGLVVVLAEGSPELLDRFAMDLPSQRVGDFILELRRLARNATKLERVLEDRYQRETPNMIHVDENGKRWAFRQERKPEVKDPRGLYIALLALEPEFSSPQRRLFALAFKEQLQTIPHHGYLNELANRSKEAATIIRDFRNWDWGDPHLVGVDDGQR